MSMPTSSPGTPDGHKLHPRCKRACRFLLANLWVAVELLLLIPSTCEPTCRTSYMLFLHWPIGPTRSPNSARRFPCSLDHRSDMQDDQVLIHFRQYLHLVDLVGCHTKFGRLLYPVLQDIFGVSIDAGYTEGCLHGDHGLWHMVHLFIILCPEGRNSILLTLLNVIVSGLVYETIQCIMYAHGNMRYLHPI